MIPIASLGLSSTATTLATGPIGLSDRYPSSVVSRLKTEGDQGRVGSESQSQTDTICMNMLLAPSKRLALATANTDQLLMVAGLDHASVVTPAIKDP